MDHVDNDDPSLIKQIQSKVLPKRGIWANKDQILITSGSQNAIYMIASSTYQTRELLWEWKTQDILM